MNTDMKIIDVDVHNALKSPRELYRYLPEPWKSQGIGLPASGYPSPIHMLRSNCSPPTGGPAASDADYLVQDLIKPLQIEYAIMTGNMFDVSALLDPDHAAAIAAAYNDYMAEQWLPKHPSFRGSIVVATQDPYLAAREIDRMADCPQMAAVVLSSAQPALLGPDSFSGISDAYFPKLPGAYDQPRLRRRAREISRIEIRDARRRNLVAAASDVAAR
ncbi:MAG: amidohydrolase [Paenibacillus sp.]|nr:amidohydrolase [Paenibacillus sp.]